MQPHKSEYWLFPKIENWSKFIKRVELICEFIRQSVIMYSMNLHVISVDEKTGIQAISRLEASAPMNKGGYLRKEYEYERHGTTTLIAATDVGSGNIINYHLGATRDEEDFADFMKLTINKLPEMDKIVVLVDQLNTHISKSLVCWIAEQGGYTKEDLGVKGQCGILKNMETRKRFLECEFHRIQFLFTPKHCSWLNPIENWFAKIQRHVIKNGNFSSVEDLQLKIVNYINFYNDELAKPLKWRFKGFFKKKKLHNINYQ